MLICSIQTNDIWFVTHDIPVNVPQTLADSCVPCCDLRVVSRFFVGHRPGSCYTSIYRQASRSREDVTASTARV